MAQQFSPVALGFPVSTLNSSPAAEYRAALHQLGTKAPVIVYVTLYVRTRACVVLPASHQHDDKEGANEPNRCGRHELSTPTQPHRHPSMYMIPLLAIFQTSECIRYHSRFYSSTPRAPTQVEGQHELGTPLHFGGTSSSTEDAGQELGRKGTSFDPVFHRCYEYRPALCRARHGMHHCMCMHRQPTVLGTIVWTLSWCAGAG